MKDKTLSPADDLRIDNLVTSVALLVARLDKHMSFERSVEARLGVVERAIPVPATYTHTQACRRLGRSPSWGYSHPEELPAPVKRNPLAYRASDVEALVIERKDVQASGSWRTPASSPRRHSQAKAAGQ